MTLHEILSPQSKHKLDLILVELCGMIISAQRRDPDYYGMVAACVLFPDGRRVYGINHRSEVGLRIHAEVAAIEACGDAINPDCTIITTLSPCNQKMADRLGLNCDHVIKEIYGIENIYCGYIDPTQEPMLVAETENPYIKKLCKDIADCFLDEATVFDPADYRGEDIEENFADGKNPGRKGLAKRSGVNTKASVSSLRKTAKHSTGEKARMAHWLANMKSGRAKAQKK